MDTKDSQNRKNCDIKQPELESLENAWLIRGPQWDSNEVGILRIPVESGKTSEETQWMQEHHNSGHALWFLSMAVHNIINGKHIEDGPRKANTVLAHLSCLREFIRNEDPRLKIIIARFIETLLSEFPTNGTSWKHFIHTHWYLIRAFAEHYDQHEKCFNQAIYEKVSDVVYGRQYLRAWWWELTLRKLAKFSRHISKEKFSKYLTKEGRSTTPFKAFFNNKMQAAIHILASPQRKREPAVVTQIVNSIDDIFHHFCPKDSRLEGLFEQLIGILKKYPKLTDDDCQKGNNIAEELLKAFNSKAAGNGGNND